MHARASQLARERALYCTAARVTPAAGVIYAHGDAEKSKGFLLFYGRVVPPWKQHTRVRVRSLNAESSAAGSLLYLATWLLLPRVEGILESKTPVCSRDRANPRVSSPRVWYRACTPREFYTRVCLGQERSARVREREISRREWERSARVQF